MPMSLSFYCQMFYEEMFVAALVDSMLAVGFESVVASEPAWVEFWVRQKRLARPSGWLRES